MAKYSTADHRDAGERHARAAAYHRVKHALHQKVSDEDADWRRAESHAEESARHRTLADHHEELAQLHLTAAGRSSSAELAVQDGKPVVSDPAPAPPEDRKAAIAALARRTGRFPAELTDRDREAYRQLARGEEAR